MKYLMAILPECMHVLCVCVSKRWDKVQATVSSLYGLARMYPNAAPSVLSDLLPSLLSSSNGSTIRFGLMSSMYSKSSSSLQFHPRFFRHHNYCFPDFSSFAHQSQRRQEGVRCGDCQSHGRREGRRDPPRDECGRSRSRDRPWGWYRPCGACDGTRCRDRREVPIRRRRPNPHPSTQSVHLGRL